MGMEDRHLMERPGWDYPFRFVYAFVNAWHTRNTPIIIYLCSTKRTHTHGMHSKGINPAHSFESRASIVGE